MLVKHRHNCIFTDVVVFQKCANSACEWHQWHIILNVLKQPRMESYMYMLLQPTGWQFVSHVGHIHITHRVNNPVLTTRRHDMVYDMIWHVKPYGMWSHGDDIWHDMTCEAADMIWHDVLWYDIWYEWHVKQQIRYTIYDMIMIWYDMIWYDIWYEIIDPTCWHSRCTVQLLTEQSTEHWVGFVNLHRHNFKMSTMASFHTDNCCLAAIQECPPVAGL